ncbi:MAG: 50S ribosomal protein L3 [Candidatus Buchananbacteria bacterium RIFCSPHIGHO2_02_FULL_38_8]|uniref:Large ribosomal subunit protein uL3 n=2 Tax=Candidatus Buchananiibacteriota TaxID=1817903 RepID=A0A1G1XZU2_9BACT|nr:MAG: 50S ribosomal protein L3 [Candidatus Buchananbacteria bacterium RIFCSPHIGHO2_01_FULL_39_8]OGY47319.1 MAG: 50S ribosomal protein L3 [Candidatus Buchananbacteria bacterium RIFCSPHIGHO2_02_FULL_38_8]
MKFILGEKREMTQKFAENGEVIPVTKVVAGLCVVIQTKTSLKDGYTAVQLGFGQKKKLGKALGGHLNNLGNFRYLREFRIDEKDQNFKPGDKITVNSFQVGDVVKVTGISKGKGFQGVVRRHGFHGSPASHGHKDQLRHSGSIGAGEPQHVFKGIRMAGRMGGGQVTVKNLEIVDIDKENQILFIKGAVPGYRGSLVLVAGPGEIKLESVATKGVEDEKKDQIEQEVKAEIKEEVKK